jgi:preprotein translocase subunit SecG
MWAIITANIVFVNILTTAMVVVHVIVSLALLVFVLLHAGRGGGLSDLFGGGSLGGSMAGSTVVEKNLDRLTIVAALIFTFTTVMLGIRLS